MRPVFIQKLKVEAKNHNFLAPVHTPQTETRTQRPLPAQSYGPVKVYGRGVERWQTADIRQEFKIDFRETGWESCHAKVEIEGISKEYLDNDRNMRVQVSDTGVFNCWHRLPKGTFTIKVYCNSNLVKEVSAEFR